MLDLVTGEKSLENLFLKVGFGMVFDRLMLKSQEKLLVFSVLLDLNNLLVVSSAH